MEQKSIHQKSVLSHTADFFLNEILTLITGAALGATIALALNYEDATAFWGMVGSLLAGLGTVGLLAFGWFKGNEWIKQVKTSKKIDFISETVKDLLLNSNDIHKTVQMNVKGEYGLYKKLLSSKKGIRNVANAETNMRFSANPSTPDLSLPQFIAQLERQLNLVYENSNTLKFFLTQENGNLLELLKYDKKVSAIYKQLRDIKKREEYSEDVSSLYDEIMFFIADTNLFCKLLIDKEIQ